MSSSDQLKEQQLALLLSAPSEAAEATYFARLCGAGTPAAGRVTVAKSATHGKGLVAARDFAQGERVLVEVPLVGMQQESNRSDALVCGECFRYVGSVEHQIARRLLADAAAEAGG
jgi:hypothetical protein